MGLSGLPETCRPTYPLKYMSPWEVMEAMESIYKEAQEYSPERILAENRKNTYPQPEDSDNVYIC